MAQVLDKVRIGEKYKIDGLNYKAVGYCLSEPGEPRKVLLLATVENYAPRRPSSPSLRFRQKSENPIAKKPIQWARLKLTEKEVLDRAAETAENRIHVSVVQGCGIPIAMRWHHNFRPRV